MKQKNYFLSLLLAAMMCVPFTKIAQVTIGSTDLPQAMLDIRAYPEKDERGQGFRLIDGNEFPGRVLTAGEDGIGTWMQPGITIYHSTIVGGIGRPRPTFTFSDFAIGTGDMFIDKGVFIDLPPGRYLVFVHMPVFFSFSIQPLEDVSFLIALVDANGTIRWNLTQTQGISPIRQNMMLRQLQSGLIDLPSATRLYVAYYGFIHRNSSGFIITQPGTVSLLGGNASGSVFAIPIGVEQ